MHPYIAQIDQVACGSGRGVAHWLWNVHRVKMFATAAGFVGGAALMHLGATPLGQVVMGLACLGFVLPVAYFIAALPVHLTLLFDARSHNEISFNTLHHTAVAWCAENPEMVAVFSHFKQVYERADSKTRVQLMCLMLGWEQPHGLQDRCMSHAQAKQRFDELFPNEVEVEDNTSAWRTFAQKYLRI